MELWFSDYHTEKVKVSVKVQKQLFGLQTEFQRIDVFDSDEFGRFLSAALYSLKRMNLFMMK